MKFTDQTGKTLELEHPPRRIVSLVPSQTELLYDLGLNREVVGITKFCVHPEDWFRNKQRVGGTKDIKPDVIRSLNPDLILANKEENEKSAVEALASEFPVWTSDIQKLSEAKRMILDMGEMTQRTLRALDMIRKIDEGFDALRIFRQDIKTIPAAYLIWNNPMMAAGGDTFISSMMDAAGFENVFSNLKRYPEITEADLIQSGAEVLFLSSEPFPFKTKHLQEYGSRFTTMKPVLADGEMFSWYGSRLVNAPAYFQSLFEQIQTVH